MKDTVTLTIESGPHAGTVVIGGTLNQALETLRHTYPGDLLIPEWWSYVDYGVRFSHYGFALAEPTEAEPDDDTVRCGYCRARVPWTEYRHGHRGGGCLEPLSEPAFQTGEVGA